MCISAYMDGDGIGFNTHVSAFFVLMQSEYDPLQNKVFTYNNIMPSCSHWIKGMSCGHCNIIPNSHYIRSRRMLRFSVT